MQNLQYICLRDIFTANCQLVIVELTFALVDNTNIYFKMKIILPADCQRVFLPKGQDYWIWTCK